MTLGETEGTGGAGPKPWSAEPPVAPDISHDAVVVVPGIMGSSLYDTGTSTPVWGMSVRLLERAWRRRDGMLPLHLTENEREGRLGRIRATGLLRFPAWAPYLKGFEPYGDLLNAVHEVTAAPAAVLEFPYDWRLSVAVTGGLLAEAARRHLTAWRAYPASRAHPDERPARLVFVAHSMGGLVTRAALAHAPDLEPDTRAVVTLGTPFLGAVKAAVILNGNRADPLPALPRRRMQALSATLPGVHDLLPDYRCIDAGLEVERLSPSDIDAIGGDRELAERSQAHQRLIRSSGRSLPGHRAVVGIAQPTMQSLRLEGGVVREQYVAFKLDGDRGLARDASGVPVRKNRAGDGTVYRDAAHLGANSDGSVTYLPLQHGALAKNSVALRYVRAVITEYDTRLGPPMGGGEIGLVLPDCAPVGSVWTLRLSGADTYVGIRCTVHEAETGRLVDTPRLAWQDGGIAARVTLPAAGLYRVRVETGGNPPVTQLVMALGSDGD